MICYILGNGIPEGIKIIYKILFVILFYYVQGFDNVLPFTVIKLRIVNLFKRIQQSIPKAVCLFKLIKSKC